MISTGIHPRKYVDTTIYRKLILEKKEYNNFKNLKKFIDNGFNEILVEQLLEIINNKPMTIQYFNDFSQKIQLEIIRRKPKLIQYINNPSKVIQLESVKQNAMNILHIKNPEDDVRLEALKRNGNLIKHLDNPTEHEKIEAVKNKGTAIQFIKNPSMEVQVMAVKENGMAIEYINNPLACVQIEAIKQNPRALLAIKNPSIEVQIKALEIDPFIIQYIRNKSPELQLKAVNGSYLTLQFISNPTTEVQLIAVRQNEAAIQFISNPSLEVQLECVKQNGLSIKFIKEPSVQVQLEAVKQNEKAIKYIENPPFEVQWEAIQKNPQIIDYIKKPFPEVQEKVINLFSKKATTKENNKMNEEINSVNKRNIQDLNKGLELEHIDKEYKELIEDIQSGKFIILDNKESVDAYLRYLAEFINIKNLYIASGFVYKSGIILLEHLFNRIDKNSGNVKLIIGSLQHYNSYKNDAKDKLILGMDKSTAHYINEMIKKENITVATLEDTFYHGKFYFLEGETRSCIIIGSSNVSKTAFNVNREFNILYVVNNDDENYKEFKKWYTDFWDECTEIKELDVDCFNDIEVGYLSNYSINKLKQDDVINRINSLTDEELKYRLNLWLKKKPDNIYSHLGIDSLNDYVLFEFGEYELFVFESFESGNSYCCFQNYELDKLLLKLNSLSKTEIFELSEMSKRGYHIKNKMNLESYINSFFVKKYKIENIID